MLKARKERQMIKIFFSSMIVVLAFFTVQACAAVHPELKPFPAAEKGMERFVIVLPEKTRTEEVDFKVELIPGKTMLTDGVNQVRHGSIIEARPLAGWGYTFYEVTGQDTAMSTMMAAPEGSDKVEQFVSGTPLLIRYNSRLPIVVYAPEGYEIKYRIWTAGNPGNADKM
jgi:ecotin